MSEMSEIEIVLCSAGASFDGGDDLRRAEIAEEWAGHDFSAYQVAEWTKAGCWDASAAAELRLAGFRPGRDTLSYRGEELAGMEAMYALCNGDKRLDALAWE